MSGDEEHAILSHRTPLLREDRHLFPAVSHLPRSNRLSTLRRHVAHFLTSKYGHYAVILLVTLDVAGIFADFIISLHICEHSSDSSFNGSVWERAVGALSIASLVFSCGFMVELLLSLWAFGWAYLKNWFHILDASVIIAGFVIDVAFRGLVEEAGSLVVVGRLWRVVKIVEELGAAGDDTLEEMQERLEKSEERVKDLERKVRQLDGDSNDGRMRD